MDQYLTYVVTLLGISLSVLCFVVIFRGKRLPGDSGSSQELEFKGFKMKTNGVVALLIVSAIVAVLPLGLQAWLESIRANKPASSSASQTLRIFITGQVLDKDGPIKGAKVSIVNMKDVKPRESLVPLAEWITDGSGSFDFPPLPLGEGDRYRVVAAKEGHLEQVFFVGPSGAVDVKTVLVSERAGGGGL